MNLELGLRYARCTTCQAVIHFVRTPSGGSMPLNPERRTLVTGKGETVQGWEPHWATCPQADEHRRPR